MEVEDPNVSSDVDREENVHEDQIRLIAPGHGQTRLRIDRTERDVSDVVDEEDGQLRNWERCPQYMSMRATPALHDVQGKAGLRRPLHPKCRSRRGRSRRFRAEGWSPMAQRHTFVGSGRRALGRSAWV